MSITITIGPVYFLTNVAKRVGIRIRIRVRIRAGRVQGAKARTQSKKSAVRETLGDDAIGGDTDPG